MLPDLIARPSIRAKVRIGKKENGHPVSTDQFRSTDPQFTEVLGEPASLTIRVPISDPQEAFSTSLEFWGPGVLKCHSRDTTVAHRRSADGSTFEADCKYRECQQYGGAGKCNAIGRLSFQIPELGQHLYMLETSSWHAMRSITGALQVAGPVIDPEQNFTLTVEHGEKGNKHFRYVKMELTA